jgi:hypothetical protein
MLCILRLRTKPGLASENSLTLSREGLDVMYHTPRNLFQCQPLILCAANDFVVQTLAQSKFLNQFGGFEEANKFITFIREYINRDIVTPPQRLPMQLIG